MYPTADQIGVAIVAAAKAMCGEEGDLWKRVALDVAGGEADTIGGGNMIGGTRRYAALALLEVFPEAQKGWIGLVVGKINAASVYMSKINPNVGYWDENKFRAVVKTLRATVKPFETPPPPPPPQPKRPAMSHRQREAMRMLEEAVRNTPRRAES